VSVVVFDGACFGDGPVTGVGRAFVNGLRAYAEVTPHECVLLVPDGARVDELSHIRQEAAPRGWWRRQRRLPETLRRLGAQLLHSSVASIPVRAPCPAIATAHDLPWLHPEAQEATGLWRRFATVRALRGAACVIAPSTMTRDDVRVLLAGRGAVERIPHGVPSPSNARIEEGARIGPLLVLGDDRPRKNRDLVRAAYDRFVRGRAEAPPLRFVGPPDSYVSEAEKDRLLRTCRAVVHASRFEGFGLPVLEALAYGAPVVCADLPPLRELAGDVPWFVDPADAASIAAGLTAITDDRRERSRQATEGPLRAARMTPEAVADAWLRLHLRLLT
jgi:hypothetical protein